MNTKTILTADLLIKMHQELTQPKLPDWKAIIIPIDDALQIFRALKKFGYKLERVKDRAIWHLNSRGSYVEIYVDVTRQLERGKIAVIRQNLDDITTAILKPELTIKPELNFDLLMHDSLYGYRFGSYNKR